MQVSSSTVRVVSASVFKSFRNLTYSSTVKRSPHVYTLVNNWGCTEEFSSVIVRNVLLNENGLLVLNKPYGVGKVRSTNERNHTAPENNKIQRVYSGVVYGRDFYLDDALPYLCKYFNYEKLQIIKIPERFSSGITLLSASDKVTSQIKNSLNRTRSTFSPDSHYWIVSVGCPEPETASAKLALKFEDSPITGEKLPILLQKWTKSAVQRKEVLPFKMEHSVLCKGQLGCLVEVQPTSIKSHILRLYMSDLLSPILGDNLYGSRVQTVLGVSIKISPFSDIAKLNKRLSDDLLSALGLNRKEECLIPAHTHLHKMILNDFQGKDRPLVLQAPPPEYFQWTCKQLALRTSEVTTVEPLISSNHCSAL